jgi:hypothetical protein
VFHGVTFEARDAKPFREERHKMHQHYTQESVSSC